MIAVETYGISTVNCETRIKSDNIQFINPFGRSAKLLSNMQRYHFKIFTQILSDDFDYQYISIICHYQYISITLNK